MTIAKAIIANRWITSQSATRRRERAAQRSQRPKCCDQSAAIMIVRVCTTMQLPLIYSETLEGPSARLRVWTWAMSSCSWSSLSATGIQKRRFSMNAVKNCMIFDGRPTNRLEEFGLSPSQMGPTVLPMAERQRVLNRGKHAACYGRLHQNRMNNWKAIVKL